MKFLSLSTGTGFDVGSSYNKQRLQKDLRENKGARYRIERLTPESREQRGFYHGAVIPLYAYLNEWDRHDSNVLEFLHGHLKREYNGEIKILDGKPVKYGKSTKGKLSKGFTDRVIDHMEEQFGIEREQVLDPKKYKKWKDEIFPYTTGDYIDYLIEIGILRYPRS